VVTVEVVTLKVALLAPAGIVNVAGTVAEEELLARLITIPPTGAAPESVTVALEDAPPATEVGFKLIEYNETVG